MRLKKIKVNKNWLIEDWKDELVFRLEKEEGYYCLKCDRFHNVKVNDTLVLKKDFLRDLLSKKEYKEVRMDKKVFLEDSLLTKEAIEIIEKYHGGKVEKIKRHLKVLGMEVDAEITIKFKTTSRKIGIELKESNLTQAIEQAIARRKFFDYFYIITKEHRALLGTYVLLASEGNEIFKKFFENKIGWIGKFEKGYFLLYPSRFLKRKFETWEAACQRPKEIRELRRLEEIKKAFKGVIGVVEE